MKTIPPRQHLTDTQVRDYLAQVIEEHIERVRTDSDISWSELMRELNTAHYILTEWARR